MKYNLICFAVGLLLGLFLGLVYCTAILNDNYPLVSTPKPKQLKKAVMQFEIGYAKSFDSLKRESAKLGSALNTTKSELQNAKQKSQSLQSQVYRLLDRPFEKQPTDTITTRMPCDSLVSTVSDLMQANTRKDTLYEQMTSTLEEQLMNRDSIITLQTAQYCQLRTSFEKSLDNQTDLVDQNKWLNKECKKQKIKSKVLSTAFFLLSGAAASYLLHH